MKRPRQPDLLQPLKALFLAGAVGACVFIGTGSYALGIAALLVMVQVQR